jgi:hypothetical protein
MQLITFGNLYRQFTQYLAHLLHQDEAGR